MRTLRTALLAGVAGAVLLLSHPAHAIWIAEGVTYQLQSQATANPLTERFALLITGENTASDTRGGRTGITGFALNEVNNGATVSGNMVFTASNATGVVPAPTGWNFVNGNVNQGGCTNNPAPNFYCFDNSAVPPTPVDALAGPLLYVFDVTLAAGNTWAGYEPSFRIDWVGSENNYSFVSHTIGIESSCPLCTPGTTSVDVPEPGSLALLGSGLVGMAGFLGWRRRKDDDGPNPAAA